MTFLMDRTPSSKREQILVAAERKDDDKTAKIMVTTVPDSHWKRVIEERAGLRPAESSHSSTR